MNSLGKQSVDPWLIEILACPVCRSDVKFHSEALICTNDKCKLKFPVVDGIPKMLPTYLGSDLRLTREKWDREYEKHPILEKIDLKHDRELYDAYSHVKRYVSRSGLFLEVGSGPSKLSCVLAKEGVKTVCIDLSLTALRIGKRLFERENVSGFFVCGDVLMMPFKGNIFSFMYAGGVIEHFKNTQQAVDEFYRCLAPNAFVTATVPYISLSTLYRILRWGNIPDVFLVKSVIELIEIKILKGRHLRFGYEKSFTPGRIRKIFGNSGFKNIEIDLFETYYPLSPIKSDLLRKLITRIAKTKPFWPMIYVNGVKI